MTRSWLIQIRWIWYWFWRTRICLLITCLALFLLQCVPSYQHLWVCFDIWCSLIMFMITRLYVYDSFSFICISLWFDISVYWQFIEFIVHFSRHLSFTMFIVYDYDLLLIAYHLSHIELTTRSLPYRTLDYALLTRNVPYRYRLYCVSYNVRLA